jgi:hypothetical protein
VVFVFTRGEANKVSSNLRFSPGLSRLVAGVELSIVYHPIQLYGTPYFFSTLKKSGLDPGRPAPYFFTALVSIAKLVEND